MSSPPAVRGQVCDRCRTKKIKCDGACPCEKCLSAAVQCVASTKLRRKTRARGFAASDEDINRLEKENSELRRLLAVERQINRELRDELPQTSVLVQHPEHESLNAGSFRHQLPAFSLPSAASGSESAIHDRHAFVVKHMGRMVCDEVDTGRFAGSTTGVHFVLSAQDLCRSFPIWQGQFPEICYKSYLLQPLENNAVVNAVNGNVTASGDSVLTVRAARDALAMTLEDVSRHVRIFNRYWEGFCPIVLCEQLVQFARSFFVEQNGMRKLDCVEYAVLQSVLLITLLNTDAFTGVNERVASTLQIVCRLHTKLTLQVDLWSLQAMILFSLFVQKSGRRLWMVPLNGVLVRTAQSLGLHRHSRRFKLEEGEVEWRKRLWWSVYLFDKTTSATHGLPQLISDVDVDSDLPVDCVLQSSQATQLVHPLPGEPTSVSLFCHYVKLAKVIAATLTQLYTTTDRRGGADKIKKLDSELRVWASSLSHNTHIRHFEFDEMTRSHTRRVSEEDDIIISPWLELMAHFSRIYIHQPGLTFEPSTKPFWVSLRACVLSAANIIDILSDKTLDSRILTFTPCGPDMVFRCALLQVFYHCHMQRSSRTEPLALSLVESQAVLHRSVRLLQHLSEHYVGGVRHTVDAPSPSQPILALAQTVQSLQIFLDEKAAPHDEMHFFQESNLPPTGGEPGDVAPQPVDADINIWSLGELQALNQIGHFDQFWNFDATFNDIS
ncbi:fungal-specific transcription factor domain-containing protein [Pyrenochaeta sp. MPI-SDFR-AT-0127]|nr:fungal-specific transcription factor domain-containing protein [Pyrenochaeta sp. MPI-SDFR-AT-0127]